MPTYEYLCENCHQRFERRQGITEAPLGACPECGGAVRRLLSGGAGILVRAGDRQSGAGQAAGCSFEREGTTCCGRTERCGKEPCGGGR
ncbi:MAG: zinc ribbon domain-containing protein [Candidatus Methylomirabilota bacterium]